MIKHAIYVALAFGLAALFLLKTVFALDNIIRPYQGARSSAMGGVKLTTGLYEENFWANPARVTDNPKSKVQILDFSTETSIGTIKNMSSLIKSFFGSRSELLTNLAQTAGKNNHFRMQLTIPGIYIVKEKMSYAFAIQLNTQADIDLRKSFAVEPDFVTDVGPSFTVGRKFLPDDALSVGLTSHITYRISSQADFTFIDVLKGKDIDPLKSGGQGTHLDFDLGSTYKLPWVWKDWNFGTSLAINHILGGKFKNLGIRPLSLNALPREQPRTLGVGASAQKEEIWKLSNTVVALEFSDIGNNPNGSFLRWIHIGAETHYGVLATRLGINQGYLTAGLGLNTKAFVMDLSTYGEEMSLNSGGLEDRRFILRILFHI
ncbi:MAG: hypothetical protein HY843_04555 [Bdellovibrio sp.]|nr:hypothetical protein [Bdellovibrio sp.]